MIRLLPTGQLQCQAARFACHDVCVMLAVAPPSPRSQLRMTASSTVSHTLLARRESSSVSISGSASASCRLMRGMMTSGAGSAAAAGRAVALARGPAAAGACLAQVSGLGSGRALLWSYASSAHLSLQRNLCIPQSTLHGIACMQAGRSGGAARRVHSRGDVGGGLAGCLLCMHADGVGWGAALGSHSPCYSYATLAEAVACLPLDQVVTRPPDLIAGPPAQMRERMRGGGLNATRPHGQRCAASAP